MTAFRKDSMKKNIIGVIADDFTGASDAASFLVKGGNQTLLLTQLPETLNVDFDCVVVALKIRSIEPIEAIEEVEKVINFFDKYNISKIYYKYCSTFDSTPKGNIGVVMDYLLERKGSKYTILCPALPVNGRTVKNGKLYVHGVPLDESPLKNHPLNPMWDSYIPNLMKPQSKYPCFCISREEMESNEKFEAILKKYDSYEHFYLVPDYENYDDGKVILDRFKHLDICSGGSGLLEFYENDTKKFLYDDFDISHQKALIVCGSCSEMTNRQVQAFKETENSYYAINGEEIMKGEIHVDDYFRKIVDHLPKTTLLYSDGCEGNLSRDSANFHEQSIKMEQFLSEIAFKARNNGFNKIIVAGGETSGAVSLKLGYHSYYVGDSVAPGVPVLIPIEDEKIRVILKSGNFGDEQFFVKAIEAK